MMIMISVGECNERVLIAELRDGHPAIILTLNVSNAVTLGPYWDGGIALKLVRLKSTSQNVYA